MIGTVLPVGAQVNGGFSKGGEDPARRELVASNERAARVRRAALASRGARAAERMGVDDVVARPSECDVRARGSDELDAVVDIEQDDEQVVQRVATVRRLPMPKSSAVCGSAGLRSPRSGDRAALVAAPRAEERVGGRRP